MELMNETYTDGKLSISTAAVTKIARCAALEVDGVREVKPLVKDNQKFFGARQNVSQGVSVTIKDSLAEVSLGIVVEYGKKVSSICSGVQENVKSAIQNMAGVTVSKVNVAVVGIAAEQN